MSDLFDDLYDLVIKAPTISTLARAGHEIDAAKENDDLGPEEAFLLSKAFTERMAKLVH
jgi:hypothetical protein